MDADEDQLNFSKTAWDSVPYWNCE